MPQEFQVLQCYSCKIFQVHQTKKTKKWACKVCGEKQSLLRAFKIGSSCDCRKLVQKLNLEAGEKYQSSAYHKNNDESKKSEDFDSLETNEFWELHNFELEPQISENSISETLEKHYEPRKKQKCDMYSEYEKSSENKLPCSHTSNSGFVSHNENQVDELQQVACSQSTSLSKTDISFDFGMNLINNNSLSAGQTNKNEKTTDNAKVNNLLFPSTSRKPPLPKNRGFQMILKAAQKLS